MSISLSEIIKKNEITSDALEAAQAITSNGLFIGKTLYLAVKDLASNTDEFEFDPCWSGGKGEIARTRAAKKVAFWIRKLFSHLKQEFLFDEIIKMISPVLQMVRKNKPFGGWGAGLFPCKSQSGGVRHWEQKFFVSAHAAALRLVQALAYQVRQSLCFDARRAVVRKNAFRLRGSSLPRLAKRVNRCWGQLCRALGGLPVECFDRIIAAANRETTDAQKISPFPIRAENRWPSDRSISEEEGEKSWRDWQRELALSSTEHKEEPGIDSEGLAKPIEESENSEGDGRTEKTRVTRAMPNTKKEPKEPSSDAIKAYRLSIAIEKTQSELADMLAAELGRSIGQGTISRWVKQVKAFLKAGNILPPLPEPCRREAPMDPRKIDLGPRQDGLAKRQRKEVEE
jgi:hypothetical protein